MIKKKRVEALILLCFIIFSLIFPVRAENVEVENININDLQKSERELLQKNFVDKIYKNYSQQNFTYVYNCFYPTIKEEISEKEYIKFQKENFEKYSLEISNIKILDLKKLKEISSEFETYLSGDDVKLISSVSVSYIASFYSSSERKIEKEVYICFRPVKDKEKEKLYLLWNPEVMK